MGVDEGGKPFVSEPFDLVNHKWSDFLYERPWGIKLPEEDQSQTMPLSGKAPVRLMAFKIEKHSAIDITGSVHRWTPSDNESITAILVEDQCMQRLRELPDARRLVSNNANGEALFAAKLLGFCKIIAVESQFAAPRAATTLCPKTIAQRYDRGSAKNYLPVCSSDQLLKRRAGATKIVAVQPNRLSALPQELKLAILEHLELKSVLSFALSGERCFYAVVKHLERHPWGCRSLRIPTRHKELVEWIEWYGPREDLSRLEHRWSSAPSLKQSSQEFASIPIQKSSSLHEQKDFTWYSVNSKVHVYFTKFRGHLYLSGFALEAEGYFFWKIGRCEGTPQDTIVIAGSKLRTMQVFIDEFGIRALIIQGSKCIPALPYATDCYEMVSGECFPYLLGYRHDVSGKSTAITVETITDKHLRASNFVGLAGFVRLRSYKMIGPGV